MERRGVVLPVGDERVAFGKQFPKREQAPPLGCPGKTVSGAATGTAGSIGAR